jgi:hypothetical protein
VYITRVNGGLAWFLVRGGESMGISSNVLN